MFKKFKVPVLTIEKNIFLNGAHFKYNKGIPSTFPKEMCLVHFNHMVGHAKKEKMKQQKMWYI
jgi:hypothetical protein